MILAISEASRLLNERSVCSSAGEVAADQEKKTHSSNSISSGSGGGSGSGGATEAVAGSVDTVVVMVAAVVDLV